MNKKHNIKINNAAETMFGSKRLKDYSKKQLMEFLQTYIKVENRIKMNSKN